MGKCEEGDCDKPAALEILTHDDTYEMLCREHARPYYGDRWPWGEDDPESS